MPTWVESLYALLEDSQTPRDVVDWNANGNGINIKDQNRFEQIVQPKWYGTNRFSSFMRSLNYYHFDRIGGIGSQCEYENTTPNFRRGHPELLRLIKRKNNNEVKAAKTKKAHPNKLIQPARGEAAGYAVPLPSRGPTSRAHNVLRGDMGVVVAGLLSGPGGGDEDFGAHEDGDEEEEEEEGGQEHGGHEYGHGSAGVMPAVGTKRPFPANAYPAYAHPSIHRQGRQPSHGQAQAAFGPHAKRQRAEAEGDAHANWHPHAHGHSPYAAGGASLGGTPYGIDALGGVALPVRGGSGGLQRSISMGYGTHDASSSMNGGFGYMSHHLSTGNGAAVSSPRHSGSLTAGHLPSPSQLPSPGAGSGGAIGFSGGMPIMPHPAMAMALRASGTGSPGRSGGGYQLPSPSHAQPRPQQQQHKPQKAAGAGMQSQGQGEEVVGFPPPVGGGGGGVGSEAHDRPPALKLNNAQAGVTLQEYVSPRAGGSQPGTAGAGGKVPITAPNPASVSGGGGAAAGGSGSGGIFGEAFGLTTSPGLGGMLMAGAASPYAGGVGAGALYGQGKASGAGADLRPTSTAFKPPVASQGQGLAGGTGAGARNLVIGLHTHSSNRGSAPLPSLTDGMTPMPMSGAGIMGGMGSMGVGVGGGVTPHFPTPGGSLGMPPAPPQPVSTEQALRHGQSGGGGAAAGRDEADEVDPAMSPLP